MDQRRLGSWLTNRSAKEISDEIRHVRSLSDAMSPDRKYLYSTIDGRQLKRYLKLWSQSDDPLESFEW